MTESCPSDNRAETLKIQRWPYERLGGVRTRFLCQRGESHATVESTREFRAVQYDRTNIPKFSVGVFVHFQETTSLFSLDLPSLAHRERQLAAKQCAEVRTELARAVSRLFTRATIDSGTQMVAREAVNRNLALIIRLIDMELQCWRVSLVGAHVS